MRAAASRSRNVWLCSPVSSKRSASPRRSPPIASSRPAAAGHFLPCQICPSCRAIAEGQGAVQQVARKRRRGLRERLTLSCKRPGLEVSDSPSHAGAAGAAIAHRGGSSESLHCAYALGPASRHPRVCPNTDPPRVKAKLAIPGPARRRGQSGRARATVPPRSASLLTACERADNPSLDRETRSPCVRFGRGAPVRWRVVSERWSCACGVSPGGWRRQP